MNNKIRSDYYILGGFLFLVDRVLKYLAVNHSQDYFLFKKLGWYPWLNTVGAFSYPATNSLIIILSIPLIIFLVYLVCIYLKKSYNQSLFFFLILLGAVSNIFDRIYYNGVVDYLYIFWGTINLADILIFVGAAFLLVSLKKS